jgi:type III restriction enzyme
VEKADMAIGKAGVEASLRSVSEPIALYESGIELPDVLTELQDRTQLTRKTIARILTESIRLNDFKRNPQQFIELAADAINRCKRLALVDGIKYVRLGDEHYYAQALFESEELSGYLRNLVLDTEKSVYEHVVSIRRPSGILRSPWRGTRRSGCMPSCPAGSRCRPRSGHTTPTGPCW